MRKILIQAAQNATKSKKSFYRAKYNKLKFRLGSANKAKVAIANRLARVTYKILVGDKYKDIGYARANPHEQKVKGLISQLRALGVNIFHHDHQTIISAQRLTVDDSGIILKN